MLQSTLTLGKTGSGLKKTPGSTYEDLVLLFAWLRRRRVVS
jgi:hypothetical protein